jgi:hypothetical protein
MTKDPTVTNKQHFASSEWQNQWKLFVSDPVLMPSGSFADRQHLQPVLLQMMMHISGKIKEDMLEGT